MSFFLLGKTAENRLHLVSDSAFVTRAEALHELGRITADPAFDGWDDEILILDDATGAPVLLVRPTTAPSSDVSAAADSGEADDALKDALRRSTVQLEADGITAPESIGPASEPDSVESDDNGSVEADADTESAAAPPPAWPWDRPDTESGPDLSALEEPGDDDESLVRAAGDAETMAVSRPVIMGAYSESEAPASDDSDDEIAVEEPEVETAEEPEGEDEPDVEDTDVEDEPEVEDTDVEDAEAPEVEEAEEFAEAPEVEGTDAEDEPEVEAPEAEPEVEAPDAEPEAETPAEEPESQTEKSGEPDEDVTEESIETVSDPSAPEPVDEGSPDAIDAEGPAVNPSLGVPVEEVDFVAEVFAANVTLDDPPVAQVESETPVIAAESDFVDLTPVTPEHESSPSLEAMTCDDCVYVETCPNRGQRMPASCGSFQWK